MRRVTVFCGSNHGARPEYVEAARGLGRVLARRGLGLVYGGSRLGTMGELAQTALAAGGEVIGVMPRILAELADAFVALPGGIGTMDEFFEMVSWTQLGLQQKGCGVLNVSGYNDTLVSFLDYATHEGFIKPGYRSIILIDDAPEGLLDRLRRFSAKRAP